MTNVAKTFHNSVVPIKIVQLRVQVSNVDTFNNVTTIRVFTRRLFVYIIWVIVKHTATSRCSIILLLSKIGQSSSSRCCFRHVFETRRNYSSTRRDHRRHFSVWCVFAIALTALSIIFFFHNFVFIFRGGTRVLVVFVNYTAWSVITKIPVAALQCYVEYTMYIIYCIQTFYSKNIQ